MPVKKPFNQDIAEKAFCDTVLPAMQEWLKNNVSNAGIAEVYDNYKYSDTSGLNPDSPGYYQEATRATAKAAKRAGEETARKVVWEMLNMLATISKVLQSKD